MKNIKCFFVFTAIFFCTILFCVSQEIESGKLIVDGLVYGYNHDPSNKFLKRGKQIILEGTLDGVSINILESGKSIFNTKTNKKGEFLLKINLGKIYKVELSKRGYTKSILIIDVKSVPGNIAANGIRFSGAELILNSFHSNDTSQINIPFGKLYYHPRSNFMDFEANQPVRKKGLLTRDDEPNTHVSLMKRAVLKNKNFVQIEKKYIQENEKEKKHLSDTILKTHINSEFTLKPMVGIENLSADKIISRESEIHKAKEQFDQDKLNSSTSYDSLLISQRETLLNSAMSELLLAKKVIELQKKGYFHSTEIIILRSLLYAALDWICVFNIHSL